jgi:chromosome segregation protein
MVYIKKIEIYGFKSFGFTNKVINLDKGLVCITGPNGSGKSNILDAIAFVLGENSPKVLRVDKLHSLIHDNENTNNHKKHTRVSITFDNKDRVIPLDTDIVTITRYMPEDNESDYLLNGKSVNKSTINDLLEVAYAVPNRLNNIQQGMVMRIAELNSEERRKILEDIIGLSYFDKKKEEAMKQLAEADRKLEIALARMGEIKKRIDELELERNNQIRFYYLEHEIKRLNSIKISNIIKSHKRRIEELKAIIDKNTKDEEALKSDLSNIRAELAKIEKEKSNIMQEVDKITKRKAEINTKISNLIIRLEQLKASKQASEQRIKSIGNTIASLIKEENVLKKRIKEQKDRAELLNNESNKLNSEKDNIQAQINNLNDKLNKLNKDLSYLNLKEEQLIASIREKESKLNSIKVKQAEYNERLKVINENIGSNIAKLNDLKGDVNKLKEDLNALEDKKNIARAEYTNIEQAIEDLNNRKNRLANYIEQALDMLERTTKVTTKYDAKISLVKDSNNEEYSASLLLKDKDPRIIGLVKDLIKYDNIYARSIIAVGYEWFNAIVVKNINDALEIIEKARNMNLSRIKVLPLDIITKLALEHNNYNGKRLADIINTKYKALADFIFDVYIADDRHKARTIAEQGFNAITLDGDLFYANLSSLSTNQITRLKDITKLIILSNSIEDLKSILSRIDKLIVIKKDQYKEMESKLNELNKKLVNEQLIIKELDTKINNINDNINRYNNIIINLEKSIGEQNSNKANIINELDNINASLVLENEIANIKRELELIKKDDLINSINNINSSKVRLITDLERVDNAIRDILTKLSASKIEYNNSERRLNEIIKELDKLKKEAKERALIIKNSKDELNTIEKELLEARDIEQHIIDLSANSVPLLKEYDTKIKVLSEKEKNITKTLSVIEKDLAIHKKEINDLILDESRLRDNLLNLGYKDLVDEELDVEPLLIELTKEYESIKHTINQLADKTYNQLISGYRGMSERKNKLEEERNSIVRFIEDIDKEKKKIFMNSFERVDKDIRHIFATMTDNLGSAWLEINDPENIFESGLSLMIQFPNKPARESTSLSGGEKTIAAITFLLALQSLKSSPYYLFDEVDAHLDAQNTERLLKILLERSKVSQMIVVTLKDIIVANANLVYGVYARNGISNIIRYTNRLAMEVK